MKIIKLKKYTDSRGSLIENTFEKLMLDSKHFFVSKSKKNVIRGNHYHLRKSEWFFIIHGICKFCIEDIKTKKRTEINIKDNDNVIINVLPNQAHAFKNIGEKELILLALVNEAHNQSDPDTYEYKIY